MKFLERLDKVNDSLYNDKSFESDKYEVYVSVYFNDRTSGWLEVSIQRFKDFRKVKTTWDFDEGMCDNNKWQDVNPNLKDMDDVVCYALKNCLNYLKNIVTEGGMKRLWSDMEVEYNKYQEMLNYE